MSGAAARTGKVYKKRKIKRYKKEINIHDGTLNVEIQQAGFR